MRTTGEKNGLAIIAQPWSELADMKIDKATQRSVVGKVRL
jgi:hypothetical protein